MAFHLKAPLAKDPFPDSLRWPLAGFSFSQSLSSLLAVGQRPLPFPCQGGLSVGQLTAWQLVSSERASKRRPRGQARWQLASFCNLISKVISHHFCPQKQVTRSSSSSGEEITQGCEYQEVGIIGSHIRNCQDTWLMTQSPLMQTEVLFL